VTEEKRSRDTIFITESDGRKGNVAIRCRDGKLLDAGYIRQLEEGKPIIGQAIRLHPRDGSNEYDVEYLTEEMSQSKGPAKVNNRAYRDNWDEIFSGESLFGKKVRPGSA